MASALNTIAKYLLSVFELRRAGMRGGENAPPWENKSMWVFYIELITGMSFFAFFMYPVIHKKTRLSEIDHVPHIFHGDHNLLRSAIEHCA